MAPVSFFNNKSKEGTSFKARILSSRSFTYVKQGKDHGAVSVTLFLEEDVKIPHVPCSQEENKAINNRTLQDATYERKRPPIELKRGQYIFVTSFDSPEGQQLDVGALVQAENVSFGINVNRTSNYTRKKREDFRGSKDLTEEEKNALMYEEVLVRQAGHPALAINGKITLLEGPSYEKCRDSFKDAVINLDYLRQERLPYIEKIVSASSASFTISENDQKMASVGSKVCVTKDDILSLTVEQLMPLGNLSEPLVVQIFNGAEYYLDEEGNIDDTYLFSGLPLVYFEVPQINWDNMGDQKSITPYFSLNKDTNTNEIPCIRNRESHLIGTLLIGLDKEEGTYLTLKMDSPLYDAKNVFNVHLKNIWQNIGPTLWRSLKAIGVAQVYVDSSYKKTRAATGTMGLSPSTLNWAPTREELDSVPVDGGFLDAPMRIIPDYLSTLLMAGLEVSQEYALTETHRLISPQTQITDLDGHFFDNTRLFGEERKKGILTTSDKLFNELETKVKSKEEIFCFLSEMSGLLATIFKKDDGWRYFCIPPFPFRDFTMERYLSTQDILKEQDFITKNKKCMEEGSFLNNEEIIKKEWQYVKYTFVAYHP